MEVLDWKETAEWLQAVTGIGFDGPEVQRVGERIVNLERLFNAARGVTRRDDGLPARFVREPLNARGESRGAVLELEAMLDEYYRARGWDERTGRPLPEKLEELGLEE
jgi:aldehyde:ferredoxin oxidoreductase